MSYWLMDNAGIHNTFPFTERKSPPVSPRSDFQPIYAAYSCSNAYDLRKKSAKVLFDGKKLPRRVERIQERSRGLVRVVRDGSNCED